jgi:hypothetical protein
MTRASAGACGAAGVDAGWWLTWPRRPRPGRYSTPTTRDDDEIPTVGFFPGRDGERRLNAEYLLYDLDGFNTTSCATCARTAHPPHADQPNRAATS